MNKVNMLVMAVLIAGCTQDQQNQLFRKGIEFLDGDYLVTFANGPTSKTWRIKNDKVTSDAKGYYYFWDEKKHYIQVPIEHTFIEEID